MKRKILGILLCVMTICATCGAFGCGETEKINNVTLDKTETIVRVGESVLLTASSDNKDEAFEWTTDNASVAEVNKYGNVTGVSEGTATVTVKQGNGSATCKVEVVETNDYPTLTLDRDRLELSLTDPITLTTKLRYKNKEVTGTFGYEVADPAIVAVTDGGVVSGKKVGNTTITVKTTYRGVMLEYVLPVSVKEVDTNFTVSTNELTLYTFDANGQYKVSEKIVAGVTVADKTVENPEIVWSVEENGKDIVGVADGVITAKKAGKTNVYADWISENGVEYKQKISVTVISTTIVMTERMDLVYKKADNDISKLAEGYADFFKNAITSVSIETADGAESVAFSQNDKAIEITDEDLTVGDYVMAFATDVITVKINVSYITRVLTTVEDILNIQTYGNLRSVYSGDLSCDIRYYDGYFVLGNNIDFKGATNNPEIAYDWFYNTSIGGFHGVFDGRGYIVKNVNITTSGGLFGGVNGVGVVKNVAFENVITNVNGEEGINGIFGTEFCGTMENVFMSVTINGKSRGGAMSNYVTGSKIKNCVFVVTGTLGSSLTGVICNELGNTQFENCYLVTELDKLFVKPSVESLEGITQGTTSVVATGLDGNIWDLGGAYPVFVTGTKVITLENREYEKYTGITGGAPVGNTADLTINLVGAISATFNDKTYNAANGKIVIPAADLIAAEAKEWKIKITTEGDIYVVNLSLYTKKISTVEDMLEIQTYGNLRTVYSSDLACDIRYYDGYFVLTNNIDFKGATNNPNIAFDWFYNTSIGGFHGIFDGRGYTVKNVNITTSGGLFGGVNGVGVVKNVAFENVIMNAKNVSGVFGAEFCGTMENVFISVTMNGNEASGAISNYVTGSKIRNCVFVVTGTVHASSGGVICNEIGNTQFENCYLVTELDKLWTKATGEIPVDNITQGTTSVVATGLDGNI